MKTMDFLTLLGELDETAAAPVDKPKRHRPLWVAAAACFCACCAGCCTGCSGAGCTGSGCV